MSNKFPKWIADSDNIVFFGGAGISTESGIPDFRSTEGLYNQEHEYPAAGLIDYYRGNKLVLINKTATPRDTCADLLLQGSIGEVFSQLEEES